MVRCHLVVAPAPATMDQVDPLGQRIQRMLLADRVHDRIAHQATLPPMINGQITTVGSGIGQHLVLFVQGLGYVQGFLGGQSPALTGRLL